MPDLFTLRVLSQGVQILDKTYFVAWDFDVDRAIITYTQDDVLEGMTQLSFADSSRMDFPTELDAHRYLTGLRYLVQKEPDTTDWRKL